MKEFTGTEEEISLDYKIQTFMNDNYKYSASEYRAALYNHIS